MCVFDFDVFFGDWVVVFGLNGLSKLYFLCLFVVGGIDFELGQEFVSDVGIEFVLYVGVLILIGVLLDEIVLYLYQLLLVYSVY